MKSKFVLPVALIIVAGTAFIGSNVFAQASQSNHPFATELAAKLGIDESKVETAFDEIRTERQKEMETAFEKRVNEALSSGKITAAQKDLILKKHEELQAQRDQERASMRDATPEERRTIMEKRHDDMKAWADENGIDYSSFFAGREGLQGRGGRGMMMR